MVFLSLAFPIVSVFLLALLTIWILDKVYLKVSIPPGRYLSIDGLRGYLALSVFIHHSYIWFFYIKTNTWKTAPSLFYGHLGDIPVALFFMITSFLFVTKLIESKNNPIDWVKLYIGRLCRLTPLLIFVVLGMVTVILIRQQGILYESIPVLVVRMFKWQSFNLFGMPLINDFKETSIIVSLVTWTLRYEWFFYLLLPIFSFFITKRFALLPVLFSLTWLVLLAYYFKIGYVTIDSFSTFSGGILAAFINKNKEIKKIFTNNLAYFLAAVALASTFFFKEIYGNWIAIALLTFTFVTIICGNSFWGLLHLRVSILLGEITYSIYLLHGIFLYVLFYFVIKIDKSYGINQYWSIIIMISPLLILLTTLTYRYVEIPGLRYGRHINSMFEKKVKNRFFAKELS